jgi:hypothetical protein
VPDGLPAGERDSLDDPDQARARAEQLITDLRRCPIGELA